MVFINPRIFLSTFIIIIYWLGNNSFAQHKSITSNLKSSEKRANELYSQGAYLEAIDLFSEVLKKNPENAEVKIKIADSYFFLHNLQEGVQWYKKALSAGVTLTSAQKLRFAQGLQESGQLSEAKQWYSSYSKDIPEDKRAKNQIEAIDNQEEFFKDSLKYKIKEVKVNSEQPDFGPAFYNDGLLFVSSRTQKGPLKYIYNRDQSSFFDLYFSKMDSFGNLQEARRFNEQVNSKYNDGPVCVYDGGKKIIFTRNDEGKKGKENTLKLYEAERSDNVSSWKKITTFPFNSSDYSIAHPTISTDGTALYFSSDMPGGFGQSDIYVSRKVNGVWSKPENLGPHVNTEGNEVFPFIHGEVLYFASNGLGGLGGLDIFQITITDLNSKATNMGYPLNSLKDDFGLILNEKNAGYFASNRKNNNDDLYWVSLINQPSMEPIVAKITGTSKIKVKVFEFDTKKPVTKASVYILNEVTGEMLSASINSEGIFYFDAFNEDTYGIIVENENYTALETSIFPAQGADIELLAYKILFNSEVFIAAHVYDSLSKEPAKLVKVVLFNEGKEKASEVSGTNGMVYFRANTMQSYQLKTESGNHKNEELSISTKSTSHVDTFRINVPLSRIKRTTLVKGVIVNSSNETPITGAEIYWLNSETGEDTTLISDQKGSFSFESKIGSSYTVMGEKGKLSAMELDFQVREPSSSVDNFIKLSAAPPFFENEVHVETIIKNPVTNEPLRFTLVTVAEEGKDTSKIYSNSEGKVHFTVSPENSFSLKTDLFEYKSESMNFKSSSGDLGDTLKITFELEKAPPLLNISAQVLDSKTNQAVDKAAIYIMNEVTGEELNIVSDQAGKFLFKTDPLHSYSILAEKGTKTAFLMNMEFTPSDTLEKVEVLLDEPVFQNVSSHNAAVFVKVIDAETKEPIKLSKVKIYEEKTLLKSQHTDPHGITRFIVDQNKELSFEAGKINFDQEVVLVNTSTNSDTVVLELRRIKHIKGAISGNIFDEAANQPLAIADVFILNENTGEQMELKSDEKGDFSFEADMEHTYGILVEKGEKSTMEVNVSPKEVLAKPGGKLQLVIESRKPVFFFVKIFDKITKEPVKAASVSVNGKTGVVDTVFTSLQGLAISKVKSKDFSLNISSVNYVEKNFYSSEATLRNDTLNAIIYLDPVPNTIFQQPGIVFNESTGKPLPDASIYVLNENTWEEEEVKTNAKGMFLFKADSKDTYSLLVKKDDLAAVMLDIKPSTRVNKPDTISVYASEENPKILVVKAVVKDFTNKQPIKLASLKLMEEKAEVATSQALHDGIYYFSLVKNKTYQIVGRHPSYKENAVDILPKNYKKDTVELEVLLEKSDLVYATLYGQLFDDETNEPIANSAILVINETTGEEKSTMTDNQGKFFTKAKYSDSYSLKSFSGDKISLITNVKPVLSESGARNEVKMFAVKSLPKKEVILTAEEVKIIEVLSGKEQLFISSNGTLYEYHSFEAEKVLRSKQERKVLETKSYTSQGKNLYEEFKSFVPESNIKSRVLIRNIYYEFNKAELTDASRAELKKIADVMKEYPEIVLKMDAFADNRGSENYNLNLSQKRARVATDYLLSHGIEKKRIISNSLGKSNLAVPCPKPEDCDEKTHHFNRRTEFEIVF